MADVLPGPDKVVVTGPRGASLLFGDGPPFAAQGVLGDFYLDWLTLTYYERTKLGWEFASNAGPLYEIGQRLQEIGDLADAFNGAAGLIAAQKGAPNGLAPLDATGKVPEANLPAVAITDTFAVASQAAMLALTAQRGDVAVRSDINKTFILTASPASTLGNWTELRTPTDLVLSVAGKVGAVILNRTDVGLSAVDNTSDADKPVSTAVSAALSGKSNTGHTHTIANVSGLQDALDARATLTKIVATQPYDPPNIAGNSSDTVQTITVTGAALGDQVLVSFSQDLGGLDLSAWVSAANTVKFWFRNPTGSAINLAAGDIKVVLLKA